MSDIERKLQAIIEAQKKQGCNRWEGMADDTLVCIDGSIEALDEKRTMIGHILEILLSPSGLKAAYGEVLVLSIPKNEHLGIYEDVQAERWEQAANDILRTWLSSNEDASATIDTAYSLLPDPR